VAVLAVDAVLAEPADPSIFVPVKLIDPDALFRATAVVPIYTVELPNTALGIVPDKLPAVKLVRLAPEPANPVAVKTPVDGTYCSLVDETYSVDALPVVTAANSG
jgi:hypothetical protein